MSEPRTHIAWQPVAAAVGLALVVHAGLLLTDVLPAMLDAWSALFPQPEVEEPTRVEMVSMTPDQFEQNRLLQDELPEIEPPPEPPAPEPEPPRPGGQVVDVAPTPDDSPPMEARFLSEHNTRVEEETVSPEPDPDYVEPKPRKTVAEAEPRPKVERPEPDPVEPEPVEPAPPDPAPEDEPEQKEADQDEPAEDEGVDMLAQVPDQDPGQPQVETEDADQASKPEGEPAPPAEGAREVAKVSDEAAPDDSGAPAPDAIRGVKTGSATFLNTREFMYATFFNRVKRLVGQTWHPAVRDTLDRHDIIGRGPTRDELVTLVHVRVAPDGQLESVRLVHSSGLAVFDDLALKAFHEAAPFPNPPRGLVGSDGRISFNFGFTISQRFGPTTRAFRPRRIR